MNKKTRNKKILVGIIIIVGAILLLNFVNDGQLFTVEQGFSALSITNAEIEDEGQKIIVYGSLTGAQELIITPNDINKYIVDDGYEATGTVTGSFSLTKQEKEFVISKF